MSGRNVVYNLNHRINKVFHDIRFGDKLKQLITLVNNLRTAVVAENKLLAGMPGCGFGIATSTKARMNGPIQYQIGGQRYSSADVGLSEKTAQLIAMANELRTDHATNKTVVTDIKTLVNSLRNQELNRCVSPANFEIVSNMDIQNGDEFEIIAAGVVVTVATDQLFDTGTGTKIATDAYFAGAILSIDGDGTTTHVDWGAEAVDAATALANLAAVTASGAVVCGYVIVETASGGSKSWIAGTDALTGGSGGDVANSTTYVNNQYVGVAGILGAAVGTSAPDSLAAAAADVLDGAAEVVLDGAAEDITAAKFGAWRFQISKTGALTSTNSNGGTGTMAYESAELALLALATQSLTADTVVVGYLVIED